MAIIPVHSRRNVPQEMEKILDALPATWIDDGLTGFPDSILGWSIAWCGTIHDWDYCTRCHAAGSMTDAKKKRADRRILENVKAALPAPLRWIGYLIFIGIYRGGYGPYDSCGPEVGIHCRHGVDVPEWMQDQYHNPEKYKLKRK